MPISRSRQRDGRGTISGTYQTFPPFASLTTQTATAGVFETCDDQICAPNEIRRPQSLLIVKKTTRLPIFSGTFPKVGTPIKQLSGCPADYHPAEPSPTSVFPPLSTVEQSSLAWESLAATNPNVAHVSLPSYWAELKDLPALWRSWGDSRLRQARELWQSYQDSDEYRPYYGRLFERALKDSKGLWTNDLAKVAAAVSPRAYIWYRWGLMPLISDIRRMFSFTEAVEKRISWLSNLLSGDRVIRRRATLRCNSNTSAPTTVQLKSVGANIQGRRTVTNFERVWCTVRWKLDEAYQISGVGLEGDPLWIKAHQLTFGLTSQDALQALWQIMPWSWFADWFLHVSTIMDATNNTIPLTWGSICLMRTTSAIANVEPMSSSTDLDWCRPMGPHQQSEVRKQRLLVSPILPFAPSFMPVFTTGQWSILGSLAVLKAVGSAIT